MARVFIIGGLRSVTEIQPTTLLSQIVNIIHTDYNSIAISLAGCIKPQSSSRIATGERYRVNMYSLRPNTLSTNITELLVCNLSTSYELS